MLTHNVHVVVSWLRQSALHMIQIFRENNGFHQFVDERRMSQALSIVSSNLLFQIKLTFSFDYRVL